MPPAAVEDAAAVVAVEESPADGEEEVVVEIATLRRRPQLLLTNGWERPATGLTTAGVLFSLVPPCPTLDRNWKQGRQECHIIGGLPLLHPYLVEAKKKIAFWDVV